jgi:cytochrome c oxidase subunit 2
MAPGEGTDEIRRERQSERAQLGPLIVLGVLASAIGIAIGLWIDWFPTPASTQADKIDTLWDVLVIASVPVFVGVVAVVLYCVWRFRLRPGQELEDGPPIHGNTQLEVIWTLIPALVILGLCTYAYFVLHDIEEAKANEMQVNVIGQQFTWTFEYGQGKNVVRSNQLYIPQNRSVKFNVKSRDVLHDFWVPDFRMKIDAVPGITTNYRVTPTRRGNFEIVCAELCGIGHAYMRQTVHVVTQREFDKWLRARRHVGASGGGGTGAAAGGTPSADGKTIFTAGNGTSTACGGCHKLADAGTQGGIGPDLGKVLAGKDAAFIKESIVDPQKQIEKGFQGGIMPNNYGEVLSPEELDALVKYVDEATP